MLCMTSGHVNTCYTVYEVMPIDVKTIECENYHSAIILPE